VDQQTRRRHASQELAVLFGVFLAAAVPLVVANVAARDWDWVAASGLLCFGMGINFSVHVRRFCSAAPEGRQDVTPSSDLPEGG